MSMRRFWFLALAACLAGCGSGNGLQLAKVRGKVLFKGEPIAGGTVVFQPDTSKGTNGPAAVGAIAKDGSFILSTEESGDGAVVGYHKVAITGIDPVPLSAGEKDSEQMTGEEFMMQKSQRSQKKVAKKAEGLTIRARDGSTYKVITPEKLVSPTTSDIVIKVSSSANIKNFTIAENGSVEIE
jgi:hypothetical protein